MKSIQRKETAVLVYKYFPFTEILLTRLKSLKSVMVIEAYFQHTSDTIM